MVEVARSKIFPQWLHFPNSYIPSTLDTNATTRSTIPVKSCCAYEVVSCLSRQQIGLDELPQAIPADTSSILLSLRFGVQHPCEIAVDIHEEVAMIPNNAGFFRLAVKEQLDVVVV